MFYIGKEGAHSYTVKNGFEFYFSCFVLAHCYVDFIFYVLYWHKRGTVNVDCKYMLYLSRFILVSREHKVTL